MSTLRILVADDHTLVRQGVRKILEVQPGWEVVAEAGDGRDAVRATLETQPDVVILDIAMPRLNGVEAVQQIVKRAPTVRVLVLSMFADEAYVTRAIRA
jgi:DNA-binding NarL/FixJ family response regulator